jgi:hypothetical protein
MVLPDEAPNFKPLGSIPFFSDGIHFVLGFLTHQTVEAFSSAERLKRGSAAGRRYNLLRAFADQAGVTPHRLHYCDKIGLLRRYILGRMTTGATTGKTCCKTNRSCSSVRCSYPSSASR